MELGKTLQRIKIAGAVLSLAAMVVLFQNCSATGFEPASRLVKGLGSAAKGNGEGYDGKPFISRVASGLLCADGSDIAAKVFIDEARGVVTTTREHCQSTFSQVALSPQEMSRIVTPHQPGIAIFNKRVFDVVPASGVPAYTRFICRADTSSTSSGERRTVDAVLQQLPLPTGAPESAYGPVLASIVIGEYRDYELLRTWDSGRLGGVFGETTSPEYSAGTMVYLFRDTLKGQAFVLTLMPEADLWTGLLKYKLEMTASTSAGQLEPVPTATTAPPLAPAVAPADSPERTLDGVEGVEIVNDLSCFKQ